MGILTQIVRWALFIVVIMGLLGGFVWRFRVMFKAWLSCAGQDE
ncbi:MAG: hypothetical protein ACR2RB_06060 [Gammaproteobacteria bacterium]